MDNGQYKKKILFLSNRSPLPIKDGHTRRTYNILKGLADNNLVHFVSLFESQEELGDSNVASLKGMCDRVEFIQAPNKNFSLEMLLRLFRSLFSIDPYTIWRHYSKDYYNRVSELIVRGNYDIVHCDNLPIAYTCRNNNSVFRSITDHDVSYLKCTRMAKETRNVALKLFLYYEALKIRNLEKRVLGQFDLGIVVSEIDKIKLHEISEDKDLLVIENGVNTDEFRPSEKVELEDNTLVWVGGFKPFSNESGMYFFLTNIYPVIKRNVPNVKLNIIGDDISTRLKKVVLSDPSIHYLGFVDNPLPYIQNSSIFIVPIISGSGTRLKLLEAMAVGKAIVTTDIGCEGIEGRKDFHYAVANTPQEFSDATANLLRNPTERVKMGINARNLVVDKYDWAVILNKLNKRYSLVVKKDTPFTSNIAFR